MWRFNEARQDHGPDRRRGDRSRQRRLPMLESLEGRQLLNCGGPSLPRAVPPPAIVNPTPAQGTPKASVDDDLIEIFDLYQRRHSDLASLQARFPEVQFQGNAVLVRVEGEGNVLVLRSSVNALGMDVTSQSPPSGPIGPLLFSPLTSAIRPMPSGGPGTVAGTTNASNVTVDGYLPIDQIQAVSNLPEVVKLSALHAVVVTPPSAVPAVVDPDLSELYTLYHECHSDLATLETRFPELQFQGNAVLVAVEGRGDYQSFLGSLGGLGMNVTSAPPEPTGIGMPLTSPILFAFHRGPSGGGGTEVPTSSPSSHIVDGYLPIDQIQAVAELPQVVRVSAVINTDAPDIIRPGTKPVLSPPPLPPAPAPIVIPSPAVPGPTLPPAPAPIVIPPAVVIPPPPVSPPALPPAPAPIVIPALPFKLPGPPVRIPGLPALLGVPPVITPSPSPMDFRPSSPGSSTLPTDSLGIPLGTGGQSQTTPTPGETGSKSSSTPQTPAPAPPPHSPFHYRPWSRHVVHSHAAGGRHHGG